MSSGPAPMLEAGAAAANAAAVRRVVLVILVLNVAVAAAKGAYAFWSGSLAVATDAFHSLLDASSNIVGMVALKLAHTPPDEQHPYGHHKIEILAAGGIGVLIGAATFQFGSSAITTLWHGPKAPNVTLVGFAIMGGTLVCNLFVALYEHRAGRRLGSPFLVADAAHTASDVVVTIGVLISLAVSHAGFAWADPVAALVVTVVIGRVAYKILLENFGVLLDQAALSVDDIRSVALAVPGVADCHRIRSRGTSGSVHIDLHLQVDGGLPLARAHDIAHEVEDRLRAGFPGVVDVTIHVEPEGDAEDPL